MESSYGTPVRLDLVSRAVRFLSDETIARTGRPASRDFLVRMGLTAQEIEEAWRLVDAGQPPHGPLTSAGYAALPGPTALAGANMFTASAGAVAGQKEHHITFTGLLLHSARFAALGALVGFLWEHFGVTEQLRQLLDDGGALAAEAEREAAASAASAHATPAAAPLPGRAEYAPWASPIDSGLPPHLQASQGYLAASPGGDYTAPWARNQASTAPTPHAHASSMFINDDVGLEPVMGDRGPRFRSAIAGIRELERDTSAGVSELRAMLRDITVNIQSSVASALTDSAASSSSLHTSVAALAEDVSALRRDLSALTEVTRSGSTAGTPASHILSEPRDRSAGRALLFSPPKAASSATGAAAAVCSSSTQPAETAAAAAAEGDAAAVTPAIQLDRIRNAVEAVAAANAAPAVTTGLSTLRMIVINLLTKQPRYRRVTATSDTFKNTVFSLTSSKQLMAACGFAPDGHVWRWSPWSFSHDTAPPHPTDQEASFQLLRDVLAFLDARSAPPPLAQPDALPVSARSRSGSVRSVASGISVGVGPRPRARSESDFVSYRDVMSLVLSGQTHLLPGVQAVPDVVHAEGAAVVEAVGTSDPPGVKPWDAPGAVKVTLNMQQFNGDIKSPGDAARYRLLAETSGEVLRGQEPPPVGNSTSSSDQAEAVTGVGQVVVPASDAVPMEADAAAVAGVLASAASALVSK